MFEAHEAVPSKVGVRTPMGVQALDPFGGGSHQLESDCPAAWVKEFLLRARPERSRDCVVMGVVD